MSDHFYTTDLTEGTKSTTSGYGFENITGFVFKNGNIPGTVAVKRYWNGKDHFYTALIHGEPPPPSNYHFEEIAWYMFQDPRDGTQPLYRLYNRSTGDHFYCADPNYEGAVKNLGYVLEGVVGYMYIDTTTGTTAIYRYWHPRFSLAPPAS